MNAMQTDWEKWFSNLAVLTHFNKLERRFGQLFEHRFLRVWYQISQRITYTQVFVNTSLAGLLELHLKLIFCIKRTSFLWLIRNAKCLEVKFVIYIPAKIRNFHIKCATNDTRTHYLWLQKRRIQTLGLVIILFL